MGPIEVLAVRRYGAHTARAIENFPIGGPGFSLGDHPALVRALIQTKRAAALANCRSGLLNAECAFSIDRACSNLLAEPDLTADFPVHILHGGGGTSANMNANEVIAHVANDLGTATPRIDPLDHVNKSQSTNDVYPAACRLALLGGLERLTAGITSGERTLLDLRRRHEEAPRLARTCLRDAVDSTFGTFFGAYYTSWQRHRHRLEAEHARLHVLGIGGGIAGEPRSTPAPYRRFVIEELRRLLNRQSLTSATDLADAAQNPDDLLALAHTLSALARTLIKQASDLRLLSSGPEGGLGEVSLPALQFGSSAIPGKTNPVVPEFVVQCCIQAIAGAAACGAATERGELDLNVWEGVFVHNLSTGLTLCATAVETFDIRCLRGLAIDVELNAARAEVPTAKMARLVQRHSYHEAARRGKQR